MPHKDWQSRTPFIWEGQTKFTVFHGVAKTIAKTYGLTEISVGSPNGVGYLLQDEEQVGTLVELARQRLNNRKLRVAKKYGIETVLLNKSVMHAESFDGTPNQAVCLVCENRTTWTGTDEQMAGVQAFGFSEEQENEEDGDAHYDSYDSEIGSYTEIVCNICDEVAWRLPRPTETDVKVLALARKMLTQGGGATFAMLQAYDAAVSRLCAWMSFDNPLSK
jgi:hypothetical protein